jgi:hypothetical protein
MPTNLTKIAAEVVGNEMTTAERLPVLCEIVRKTEHLQVRAIAVLYADCEWENTHETWTNFCRHEFNWDDSYASRMKKAAQMIIGGTTITNESQARALATVSPDKREDVLGKARDKAGSEPSATQISAVIKAEQAEGSALTDGMTEAQDEIDDCISDLRAVLKRIKALDPKNVGRWINLAHLIADMKSAADTLKHARPHAACDERGNHDASCLCGGNNWLPKHVIERPKSEKNK